MRDAKAYFQTALANDGMLFLSVGSQDGARLLIPDNCSSELLNQMKRGNIIKIFQVGSGAFIIFDDRSDTPPILNLHATLLEIDEQRHDTSRSRWFPLVAWGPHGYLYEWLCRWCDSDEQDQWLDHTLRPDANLL